MKTDYTTLQITKEVNKHIRRFCTEHGVNASYITEKLWVHFISASLQIDVIVDLTPEVKSIMFNEISGSKFYRDNL